jgi:ATP-dependent protease ClpP protease subunit
MLEQLEKQDFLTEDKQPITIKIDSFGGSAYACLSIISKIEELKLKGYDIITIAYGKAMSAGIFILLTGTTRKAQRYCRMMIHQLQGDDGGFNSVESSKRNLQEKEEMWQAIREITKNNTKVTDELLDKITEYDKDEFFFSDKAIELGIIDSII